MRPPVPPRKWETVEPEEPVWAWRALFALAGMTVVVLFATLIWIVAWMVTRAIG
jgi:hypothetical protein